jgi:hypothetical protein
MNNPRQKALGRDFDLTWPGRPAFKAPERVDSGEWVSSGPLTMHALGGSRVFPSIQEL